MSKRKHIDIDEEAEDDELEEVIELNKQGVDLSTRESPR
jgi:hypothetical protein